jgi:hypothetical protein
MFVDVHADHVIACIGKARALHKADISGSYDREIHGRLLFMIELLVPGRAAVFLPDSARHYRPLLRAVPLIETIEAIFKPGRCTPPQFLDSGDIQKFLRRTIRF